MTDESHTPEPQPPSNRSTDAESVANIGVLSVLSVVLGGVLSVLSVVLGGGVLSGVLSGVGVGVLGGVGGVVIVDLNRGVSSAAFITFIGKAVRGVSRLRLTLRQTGVAAPFAVAVWIGGRSRKEQTEDWRVAFTKSPRPIRYSLGLVVAATRMRLCDLGGLLLKAARWVLATDTRTWTPLIGLLLWGGIETTLDTGLGAAILAVISGGAVLQACVTWGRKQLGVEAQQRKSTE